ncbi:MAG: hypothetical protein MK193_01945 [Lentisphaeria bacterium]|nr:hypothetical protein [Lentisphaeria bacterium]
MKSKFVLSLVAVGLGFFSAGCSSTKSANTGDTKGKTDPVVAKYETANGLAKYSKDNKDAVGLGIAAAMMKEVEVTTVEIDFESEPAAASSDKEPLRADALKEEALAMATPGQKVVIEERFAAVQVPDTKTRGRVGGPGEYVGRVNARETDEFVVSFRGGKPAWIYVSGDGDTDLDLYVYDENGNRIGEDEDGTDECLVRFNPIWTGPFTIRVKNRGNIYNAYKLVTN